MKFIRNKWFIALILLIITTVIAITFVSPEYETNDDLGFIQLFSGALGAQPSTYWEIDQFILLSNIMPILYKINRNIPWYGLFFYFLTFAGFLYFIYLILSVFSNIYMRGISILIFLFFYFDIFLQLNFTKTALFLWFTMWLIIGYKNVLKEKCSVKEIPIILFLILALLIRPRQILNYSIYILPIFSTFFIVKNWKRFFIIISILFISIGTIYIIANHFKDQKFMKFYSSTRIFNDTALSNYTKNTKKALLSADWTKNDFELIRYFFYYDEEIFSTRNITNFIKSNSNNRTDIFQINFQKIKQHFKLPLYPLYFFTLFIIIILIVYWKN
ncbi:hypothetical protein J7L48_06645 [bacterium]|nr:hypothetical protein [bacterium]